MPFWQEIMNNKKKKIIYNVALIILAVAAVGSGGTIIARIMAQQKNDKALMSLSRSIGRPTEDTVIMQETDKNKKGSAPPERTVTPEDALRTRGERIGGYLELQAQNPDMAGWVSIPQTQIDYPVMQTKDRPDYYLKHNFEGERSSYGVPYAAEDSDLYNGNNVIVYGHHMKNGSMFAGLGRYTEEAFYREHPWFWFDTPEGAGLYQIIGICTASASDGDKLFTMARIDDEQGYKDYVEEIKRRSFYDTGVNASWGEPLVTLMTCEYTTTDGRLLVVGKKY